MAKFIALKDNQTHGLYHYKGEVVDFSKLPNKHWKALKEDGEAEQNNKVPAK